MDDDEYAAVDCIALLISVLEVKLIYAILPTHPNIRDEWVIYHMDFRQVVLISQVAINLVSVYAGFCAVF